MTDIKEKYPEHVKLSEVVDKSQAIGEFIEHSGFILAEYREGASGDALVPVGKPIQDILAEYFEIDLQKLETEKRKMIEEITASN